MMVRTIGLLTVIGAASLAFAGVAAAQSEFDAKPMNAGPPNMMMMPMGQMMQPMAEPMAQPMDKPMMHKKHMSKKMMKKKMM